jgi:hypothetical protein
MSNANRVVLSVLIASATSFLPILSFPGALLTGLVFGTTLQLTSPLVKAVCNFLVWLPAVYFFPNMWRWGTPPTRQTPTAAKALFVAWLVLLIPWFVFAPLSGMAFDSGPTAEAYTFVWSVWMYPVTVGIAAIVRRWMPWIVLLPFLNMAACFAPGLWPK